MVQRYSINECASTGMDHDSDGDYVLYDDYEELALQYDNLQKECDKLLAAIGNLYRAC